MKIRDNYLTLNEIINKRIGFKFYDKNRTLW